MRSQTCLERLPGAFLLVALAAFAQTQPAPKGIVEGVVEDGLTGRPLEDARVKLIGLVKAVSPGPVMFTAVGSLHA